LKSSSLPNFVFDTAELGSDDDFNKKLSAAFDPLAQKIMNAPGDVVVD
jgi:hypothetical protein